MIKMKPAATGSSRELGYYNDIEQFQSAIKFILGDKICWSLFIGSNMLVIFDQNGWIRFETVIRI